MKSRDANVFPNPFPAIRLPPELIAQIFLALGVQDRNVCVQICRTWRTIALSTPQLWSTVSIFLTEHKYDDQMFYVQIICDRAGVLPLSVTLHSMAKKFYRFIGQFLRHRSPIPTLVPYLSRIKDLSLSLSEVGIQSFCQLPVGSFPLLESCAIWVSIGRRTSEQLLPTTALESAPHLQRFTFNDQSAPHFDLSLLRLPSNLIYLNVESNLAPSKLLDILRQCPDLEELDPVKIEFIHSNYTGDIIVLSRLCGLALWADQPSVVTFFQHITVPSFRSLRLHVRAETYGTLIPASLKSLLLRSSCPLNTYLSER
jgi:hypothetical protein